MLKFGNKEFRNLQEQVEENMKNIQDLMQGQVVLDEFGIKVIGQEASVDDMPTVEEYKEEHEDWSYGDAYAIGTETPYSLYILTRGNNENPDDYWFDIGVFPMPGPRGLQGETGDTGPQGQTGPQGEQGRDGEDGVDALVYDTMYRSNSDPTGSSEINLGAKTSSRFNREPRLGDALIIPWIVNNTNDTYMCEMKVSRFEGESQYVYVEMVEYVKINPLYVSWSSITGKPTFSTVATSGSYNDLTNKPTIPTKTSQLTNDSLFITAGALVPYAQKEELSNVAFSGDYDDLSNKPDIPEAINTYVVNVAHPGGGNPNDLVFFKNVSGQTSTYTYTPTVPTKTSDLTNDSGFITSASVPTKTSDLTNDSGYITSSDIPVQDVQIDGVSIVSNNEVVLGNAALCDSTANVTSGSGDLVTSGGVYNAIQSITPFTQVQSDYAQTNTSAVDYIKNKPDLSVYALSSSLSTVATSGSYNDLSNKPSLFDGDYDSLTNKPDLSIYAESSDLSSVAFSGDYDDLSNKPTIPTVDYPVTDVQVDGVSVVSNKVASITMPTIPTKTSDLTNDSGFITASDIPSIPTKTSDLTNDSGFITDSALSGYATEQWVVNQDYLKSVSWGDVSNKPTFSTVATTGDYDDLLNKPTLFSGNYNDLTNKPSIPTKTSDLTNDSGFITSSALPTKLSDLTNDEGFITGITSSDVTTALGYTPYNSTNPNGYTSNVGTVTSVNNTQPDANGNVSIAIPDVSNMVTTNTPQSLYGSKTFYSVASFDGGIRVFDGVGDTTFTTYGKSSIHKPQNVIITLPTSTGTLALTSDIPTVPTNISAFTNDSGYLTSSTGVTSVNGSSGAITNIATLSDIPTVDQTYSASSTKAQSGVAVSSGISSAISGQSHEVWTFTLSDNTTVTKDVVLH